MWAEIQCLSCFQVSVIPVNQINLGWTLDCGHVHPRFGLALLCEDGSELENPQLVRSRKGQ